MNSWSISIQNIISKPLYTFLSIFILSLSITLLLGIQQLQYSFQNQIENNLGKIDLVIGAKGSPLQLVLASVLHLDNPTGNIPYQEVQKIAKNPMVASATPISYGDNYKGYRIIGTTQNFISLYDAQLNIGRNVQESMEVVLGNSVAKQLNLKIGDKLLSSHGLIENTIEVHADELTVVGVLKPTQKVIDRLIITNLETIWDVHDHEEEDEEDHTEEHHEHTEDKEVTSLLVKFRSPRALISFPKIINKQTNLQAALPKYELDKLYEYTSIGFQTVSLIAYLILLISCITIFMSLYKMVKERAFDLAILRTYGATHFQLIKMMLYEGLIITFSAFLIGFIFIKIGLHIFLHTMQTSYHYNVLQTLPLMEVLQIGLLILIVVIISVSLAILPLIKMNISTILSNEK